MGFRFDLKSAYHHVRIFPDHRTYLGFFGDAHYYVFNVLPFGISTAAFIFTKVLRHLVQYWRSRGIRIISFLDDGIAAADSASEARTISDQIRQDLCDFGFIIAEEGSDWIPRSKVTWLAGPTLPVSQLYQRMLQTVQGIKPRKTSLTMLCLNLAERLAGGRIRVRQPKV